MNFFSSVPYLSVGTSIDLKDYLTEDSDEEISRDFQHIQEDATSSKYFHKASNFGITVTDLKKIGSQSLYDYFRVFKDNTFVRYKVQVRYDSQLVFQGVIYPDGITYEDPEHDGGTDSSSKIIHLDVIGYEKEFAEYFKNQKLKPGSELPFQNTFYDNGEQVKHINFITLLLKIFPGTSISTPSHITDWNIVYDSTFQYADNKGLFFIPVGYVQIERNGANCYEFLEKICNGMGWVFQFIYVNGSPVLYINDLSFAADNLPSFILGPEKIIGISSINSEGKQNLNKYIGIFPHLDLVGGDKAFSYYSNPTEFKQLKGAHDIFISKDEVLELNGYHFSTITISNDNPKYRLVPRPNLTLFKYRSQDSHSKLYEKLVWNGSGYNSSLQYIKHKDILALDTGHNTRFKRKVNLNDKSVTASDEGDTTIGDWHLVFSGCYAASLFKIHTVENGIQYQYSNPDTNKSYIHSSLFLNNMRALFNSFSKNYLEISFALDSATIKQLLTNPVHYVIIRGHENPDLNHKFISLSHSINIFNDTISYKLIKK